MAWGLVFPFPAGRGVANLGVRRLSYAAEQRADAPQAGEGAAARERLDEPNEAVGLLRWSEAGRGGGETSRHSAEGKGAPPSIISSVLRAPSPARAGRSRRGTPGGAPGRGGGGPRRPRAPRRGYPGGAGTASPARGRGVGAAGARARRRRGFPFPGGRRSERRDVEDGGGRARRRHDGGAQGKERVADELRVGGPEGDDPGGRRRDLGLRRGGRGAARLWRFRRSAAAEGLRRLQNGVPRREPAGPGGGGAPRRGGGPCP